MTYCGHIPKANEHYAVNCRRNVEPFSLARDERPVADFIRRAVKSATDLCQH